MAQAKSSPRAKEKVPPKATRSEKLPSRAKAKAPSKVESKKPLAPKKAAAQKGLAAKAPRALAEPKAAPGKAKPGKVPAASKLELGSKAPAFELSDGDQNLVSSSALRGKPYVLYFYPKDNTPGCTTEACDFRDQHSTLRKLGVQVLGVSPDSADSHRGFAAKFRLPFPLISDPDKELATAYGVYALKKNYGREFMGIIRSTFLIDAEGILRAAWRGVRVPGHVEAVIGEIKKVGQL